MKVTELDFQFMLECQERDIATILVEECLYIKLWMCSMVLRHINCFRIQRRVFISNHQDMYIHICKRKLQMER